MGRGSFFAILCGAWLLHYDEEHKPAQEKLQEQKNLIKQVIDFNSLSEAEKEDSGTWLCLIYFCIVLRGMVLGRDERGFEQRFPHAAGNWRKSSGRRFLLKSSWGKAINCSGTMK
jgi:hypothetical protein